MCRLLVVIEGAEGNYSAYSPDLDGCVATGHTVEEVRQVMQEAIALHIRGMQEDGLHIPKTQAIGGYVAVA
jgi:predicted RNase H-like HicB family nuclease